jgi:cytoskeleton protein RodZ
MVPNINVDALKPAMPAAPVADTAQGEYSLSLTLANPSWVEVTAADGSRLEYGLLPAGTQKTYHSDSALEIRLGNATGATVAIDGKQVSLDDYRRANVAHFRVSMQDGKAVPSGV